MNILKTSTYRGVPPVTIVIVILIASMGWRYSHTPKIHPLDQETLATTVDTTVKNLTVRQYDATGKLIHVLNTPLLQHTPKDDVNLLQQPHILVAKENEGSWEIHSQKARSYEGGTRINFVEQVVVHQKAHANNQESTLKTEEVTYYPKEKKAVSDQLVTYEQPGNFVQSTGMVAYLEEKRVEMLHGARGSYDPAKG